MEIAICMLHEMAQAQLRMEFNIVIVTWFRIRIHYNLDLDHGPAFGSILIRILKLNLVYCMLWTGKSLKNRRTTS